MRHTCTRQNSVTSGRDRGACREGTVTEGYLETTGFFLFLFLVVKLLPIILEVGVSGGKEGRYESRFSNARQTYATGTE